MATGGFSVMVRKTKRKVKDTIEFIEDTHQYIRNGIIVPSVSAVIRVEGEFDHIPERYMEVARFRGSAVHLATELFDLGKRIELPHELLNWFIPYTRFQREYDIKWTGIEEIVHTEDYAGTLDRIQVSTCGLKILIADVKTTSKVYKEKVALQLGAYAIAHSKMYGHPLENYVCGVIWLREHKYKWVEIEPDIEGFKIKLEEYKAKQKIEKIGDLF
jgi:hypothetical protein